jgi:hypothetical protein
MNAPFGPRKKVKGKSRAFPFSFFLYPWSAYGLIYVIGGEQANPGGLRQRGKVAATLPIVRISPVVQSSATRETPMITRNRFTARVG